MDLQQVMQLYSGGHGIIGPSDQTTLCTLHNSPVLSTKQSETCSVTPPRLAEGAADADRPTTDVAKEGVDAGLDREMDAFP